MPRWVVYSVAAATFLDLSILLDVIPPLAVIRAPLLLFAAATVGLALNTRSWRPRDMSKSRLFRLLGIVVAIGIIGIPFAIVSTRAFNVLVGDYSKVLLQGAMLWAVCRTSDNRVIVYRTVIVAICIACVTGIVSPRGDGNRLQASSYDANSLALLANLLLPMLAWYFYDRRNPFRFLALAALPIPALTIALAGSRGGVLAFGMMGASTALFATPRAPRALRRLFPMAALIAVIGVMAAPTVILERVQSVLEGSDYNLTADSGRLQVWKRGVGYALEHPVLGVGIANFPEAEGRSGLAAAYARQGLGFGRFVAHSTYIESIVDLGFIGGSAFILLLLLTIRDLFMGTRVAQRARDPDAILVGTLAIGFVGFAVSVLFLSYQYYNLPYILYGVAYGYLDRIDQPGAGPTVPRAGRAVGRRSLPRAGVPARARR